MKKKLDDGWAAVGIVEIEIPDGENEVILIQGKNAPSPVKWRIPGGCRESWESDPGATVKREITEEIGLDFPEERYELIYEETVHPKSAHAGSSHRFTGWTMEPITPEEANGVKRGEEIAVIRHFTIPEIWKLIENQELLPRHANALAKWLILRGYGLYEGHAD